MFCDCIGNRYSKGAILKREFRCIRLKKRNARRFTGSKLYEIAVPVNASYLRMRIPPQKGFRESPRPASNLQYFAFIINCKRFFVLFLKAVCKS